VDAHLKYEYYIYFSLRRIRGLQSMVYNAMHNIQIRLVLCDIITIPIVLEKNQQPTQKDKMIRIKYGRC